MAVHRAQGEDFGEPVVEDALVYLAHKDRRELQLWRRWEKARPDLAGDAAEPMEAFVLTGRPAGAAGEDRVVWTWSDRFAVQARRVACVAHRWTRVFVVVAEHKHPCDVTIRVYEVDTTVSAANAAEPAAAWSAAVETRTWHDAGQLGHVRAMARAEGLLVCYTHPCGEETLLEYRYKEKDLREVRSRRWTTAPRTKRLVAEAHGSHEP